jgi:outer membrane protein
MRTPLTSGLLALAGAVGVPPAAGAQVGGSTDSLTRERATAIARERSPLVAAADAALDGARGQVIEARSYRAPRIALGGLYLRFQDPPGLALGPTNVFTPLTKNTYLAQVIVRQPVYTGGRVTHGIRAAEALRRSTEAARTQVDVELSATVAHAHDGVLLARALVEVAREGEAVLDSAATLAEERFTAGAVSRFDILRAQTRLASAQSERRAAEAVLAERSEQLAVVIGIDSEHAPPVAGALVPADDRPDSATVAMLLRFARGDRPDVRALDEGARAAEARARVARAALRPTASLFGAALLSRPELATARPGWTTEWFGGVIVEWPVFDFGATAGQARAARAEADRLRAEIRQASDAAAAAVLARVRDLARAETDMAAGRENALRAERALEIARDRYAGGIGIQLDVLEAQADLVRTRADLMRAIHTHRSAAVELRRAAGRPADAPLPDASPVAPEDER